MGIGGRRNWCALQTLLKGRSVSMRGSPQRPRRTGRGTHAPAPTCAAQTTPPTHVHTHLDVGHAAFLEPPALAALVHVVLVQSGFQHGGPLPLGLRNALRLLHSARQSVTETCHTP
jgi:hypothetical protein